ncbi:uncharacterized protein LOC62_03G003913 [Vanrija pseudolonga]|uniref:BTB domain-containing protein n=1 Tax=Vanrija pseudolonga TaxID=143232 RepID=A0AAF1BGY3_9TREE|nr:hypothetical protein LOC62_03G003913 [Vanrija pseudolonga]
MGDNKGIHILQATTATQEYISDDPTWASGDFTLISTDGIRFRVPSWFILAASPVFRDADGSGTTSGDKQLDFTDSHCETASTLCDFLALVTTSKLHTLWVSYGVVELCEHISNLVTFLRKYDCEGPLHSLILAFHYAFLLRDDRDSSLEALLLGAMADNVDYCKKAIRASKWEYVVDTSPTNPLAEARRGCFTLLPCNMPLIVYELFPTKYSWALGRSWPDAADDRGRWVELFAGLVEKASASR